MNRVFLIRLAVAASALALAGAYLSQHVFGIEPCHLCLLQRYPHWVLIAVGLLALYVPGRLLPALGGLISFGAMLLSVYHSGVERKLWDGPSDCTGGAGDLTGLSGADLLSTDFDGGLVLCDEIAFSFLGLTFANMNVLLCAGLVIVWAMAARRS
ncbi:disulfide bond formation protein B [Tropicimonas sp. TH_r6]|uniref:disulfide bond formation protein B n=1 Tax=Tropicimonas sp. TH_r6 TaxID=3082085 RepID=UPI002953F097|nr:disulfide bond formation protein B [Tropicimonas sp. TH_r6]MDV7144821.1 disulfide bond formation protein B [Tropicimonas sp. TH_r6]